MGEGKLVILKLEGDLKEQGFQVTLEIRKENGKLCVEVPGTLPANPTLSKLIKVHWLEKYRFLAAPYYRIKPKRIRKSVSLDDCKKSAQELENQMENWLKSDDFRKIDQCLREELSHQEKIRFLIRTNDLEIPKMPWHLWNFFDRYIKAEIGWSRLGFQRTTSESTNIKKYPSKNKVRILVILGHKEGINLEKDRHFFATLPQAQVEFLDEPTVTQIQQKLWETEPWDILFFAGHSETEGETGRLYINPQDSIDMTDNRETNELWYSLRKAIERGLKLAIFNSCDGLGLAQRLNDWQIPQMIVMRDLVPDQVAHEFLKEFLQLFSQGKSLYISVREAREKLHILEKEIPCASWLPVIVQNPGEVPVRWEDLLSKSKMSLGSFLGKKWIVTVSRLVSFILLLLFSLSMTSYKLNQIGADQVNQGNLAKAKQYLTWAYRLNPYNSRAKNNLGFVYERLGESELGRKLFLEANLDGNLSGCNNYAASYNEDKKFIEAEALLQRCLGQLEKDPNKSGTSQHYKMLVNLAWSLFEQSQLDPNQKDLQDEAKHHLELAVEFRPQWGRANCLLTLIYYNQDRIVEAKGHGKICLEEGWDEYPEELEWKRAVKRLPLGLKDQEQ